MPASGRPEKVHTVLFDAGGVLLDLDYSYLARLLRRHGVDAAPRALSRAEAQARFEVERRVADGARPIDVWRDYFGSILGRVHVPLELHERIIDTLWDAHRRVGLWTVPIPGSRETVRELRRRGLRIGVVSNAEGRVEQDLYAAGFDGLLETVVDSHVVGVEKPHPEIFHIALQRMDADAAATVFIGDVPSVDVVGARAAGIAPVLLDRHDLYTDVDAPRLRSIRELPSWLPRRPGSG
jgi:putative hydrolase of the HAD superfamily